MQRYAQDVHGMLCRKELTGELEKARRTKRGLREVRLPNIVSPAIRKKLHPSVMQ